VPGVSKFIAAYGTYRIRRIGTQISFSRQESVDKDDPPTYDDDSLDFDVRVSGGDHKLVSCF